MKKTIFWIFIFMLIACSEKVIEKPDSLIPKDQMIDILYDMAIINAAKKTNPSYLVDRELETMSFIYQKYKIDSIQFVNSDIYYASIPMEYEAIYKVVEARLEEEKSVFDRDKTRASDSIRKIAEEQREKLRQEAIKQNEKDTLP